MLSSNNSTENYGRRWARIRFCWDLYYQESTFPPVYITLVTLLFYVFTFVFTCVVFYLPLFYHMLSKL